MALPALTYLQRDFSGGQITGKAARRDDLALQRSGLRRYVNARPLATGALAQRFGRSVYAIDSGRSETVRFSDDLSFEFLFGDGDLTIRDSDGDIINTFMSLPWSLETVDEINLAVCERDVIIGYRNNRLKHLRLDVATLLDTSIGEFFSDMTQNLAAPSYAAFSRNAYGGNSLTSFEMVLPAANPGDIFVIDFRSAGSDVTHTTPDGWTLLDTRASSGRSSIWWKVATGADENPSIVISAARRAVWVISRITGGTSVEGAFESSNTLNPPSLSPSWGSLPTLWMAVEDQRGISTGTPTQPSGYSSPVVSVTAVGSSADTDHAEMALAYKSTTASSENPGAFSTSGTSDSPHAATIGIEPDDQTEFGKAFDDVNSKSAANCVTKDTDTEAIIGIDYSSDPQAIGGVIVRGSNDAGFVAGATPTVTLTLYGKDSSVPTLASRGDSLGTTDFTDTSDESAGREITSSDSSTTYDYFAVVVEHDGSAADIYVAQITPLAPAASTDSWELTNFTFAETLGGAKKQPYYKFARGTVEMLPSARTGDGITLTFTEAILDDPGHVGVSFRYHGREVLVTSITNSTVAVANVIETLPPTMRVTCASANQRNSIKLGEVVVGETSGSEGLVVAYNSTADLDVIVYTGDNFTDTEYIASPSGRAAVSGTPSEQTAASSFVWDEAVMSDFRGWPNGVEWDRFRLALCDFPQLPRAIVWSAVGEPTDCLTGSDADEAIFEFAPGPGRVLHVIGGADQFVLTDLGCLYIPISEANPLAPGSVSFRSIAAVGAGSVQPVTMHEGVVYASENRKTLIGIVPTGQTSFPYKTVNLSEFHSDLFTGVRGLAAMTGGGDAAEQYLWVSQDDGTAITGKYDAANQWVGFVSVTSDGLIKWISALGGSVLFNVLYDDVWTMEYLDESQYLDCAIPLNDPLPVLRPDPEDTSKGRLWFLAGMTVDLVDGDEYLGARAVDDDGFITEEAGDDFTSNTIMAGFGWTVDVSPWMPNQGEGAAGGQRRRRRRVKEAAVFVQDSTAFAFIGRTFGGDSATVSGTFKARGQRREFEPEARLLKTTPGPLLITELSGEVTT